MKSMCSCRAALAATLVFFTILAASACGDAVSELQSFKPNKAPIITGMSVTDAKGNPLSIQDVSNGLPLWIAVTATDPEHDALAYEFSGALVYNNLSVTPSGCTIFGKTEGVQGGIPVAIRVVVRDAKNASTTVSYDLGTGKLGPSVSIDTAAQPYMKSSDATEFSFMATSSGYYRVIEAADIPDEAAAKAVDGPLFQYNASADVQNPLYVPITLSGAGSAAPGIIKLSSGDGPKRIWIVFWDSLYQYTWSHALVTLDDTAPVISDSTPSNAAVNVEPGSGISVRFSENDEIDSASLAGALLVTPAEGLSVGTLTYADKVAHWPITGLKYNTNYSVTLNSVRDRAGNPLAGGSGFSFATAVGPVTGIDLNKASTVIVIGSTEQLFASVTPSNAANTAVTWVSDKPSIASVNSSGVVTAVAEGTAIITATTVDGGIPASCTVTVSNLVIPVTGLDIANGKSMNIGDSVTIVPHFTPSNATNQNVIWSSSNSAVATVSTGGKVTGIGKGSATITATAADITNGTIADTATYTITKPVTGVSVSPTSLVLLAGGAPQTLLASVAPPDASELGVVWSSSNSSVASVNSSGVVTPLAQGSALITATTVDGGKTASCSVTVNLPTVLAPVITGGGVYDEENATVSMACATSGAAIRYTTDGTTPTPSSALYTSEITLTESKTVNAIAFKDGWNNSNMTSALVDIRRWQTVGTPGFTANTVTNVVLDTQLSGLKSSLMVGFAENNGTDVRGSIMRYSGSTWGYLTRLAIPNIFTQRFTSPLAGMGLDFSAGGTDETWMSLITSGNAGYIYAQNGTSMGTPVALGSGLKDMSMAVVQGRTTTDIYLCRQTTANVVSVLKNGVAHGAFPSKDGDQPSIVVYSGNVYVSMRDVSGSPATYRPWVYTCPTATEDWSPVGGAATHSYAVADLALSINKTGPVIAFADGKVSNKLTVQQYSVTGGWVNVGVGGISSGTASYIQLKCDASNMLWVVYRDAADNRAHMKRRKDGEWAEIGSCSGSSDASNIGFTLWNNDPCVGYRDGSASNKLTVRVLRKQ